MLIKGRKENFYVGSDGYISTTYCNNRRTENFFKTTSFRSESRKQIIKDLCLAE